MKALPEGFEELADRVISGKAADDELDAFRDLLKDDVKLLDEYIAQMQVHCGLVARVRFGVREDADGPFREADDAPRRYAPKRPRPSCRPTRRLGRERLARAAGSSRPQYRGRWWAMAAAVAVLLGGAWMLREGMPSAAGAAGRLSPAGDSSIPPVRLVSQSGVSGLDLPAALPGAVRLAAGEAVVRLESGVELSLAGPVNLQIRDNMQVFLESGRLLANVPHWASGFTVLAPGLEVWDLGTVFSVAVSDDVSDVFVFKGSVQVNESSGEGVGLCEAGEGVRAVAGKHTVKVQTDWPDALKLFATVRGFAAIEKSAAAISVASEIADLWIDRYMPEESEALAARRLAAALALKTPFRKTAWVRTAVPMQQEDTSNMNKASVAAVLTAAAVTMGAEPAGAISEPVFVNFSPHLNRCWTTVFTNEVPLRWDWNAAATHAELEIVGMNGSFTTNITEVTSNVLWRAFTTGVPADEDVYDLTLTFKSSGDVVVGALTSRLAVVRGAFGVTSLDLGLSDRKWEKVKTNVVIPYDATWTEATAEATRCRLIIAKIAGAVQTNTLADASGYLGWKLKNSEWGYGRFNLFLSFPEAQGEWQAALTRLPSGTLIGVK